jgi:hypothetical protein
MTCVDLLRIALNFSGIKIAQSGTNGPYTIRNAGVTCNSGQAFSDPLFQTQSFTASQFHFVPQGVSLLLAPATQAILVGASGVTQVSINTTGAMSSLSSTYPSAGCPPGLPHLLPRRPPPCGLDPGRRFVTLAVVDTVTLGVSC